MITFCLGSARQKRAYFKYFSGAVVLDNTEVLFCASENGKNYFAYGETPFAEFTVDGYLAYRTAFCGGEAWGKLDEAEKQKRLSVFGLKPGKRIGRLCPAEMRCVMLLEKSCGKSNGIDANTVVVNLDGTKYSRRNELALKRILSAYKNVYVCVTDDRFVKRFEGARTLKFGKANGARPEFYAAKLLAKRLNAKRVGIF